PATAKTRTTIAVVLMASFLSVCWMADCTRRHCFPFLRRGLGDSEARSTATGLLHLQQFHLAAERRIGRDYFARAAGPIAQIGGDEELALAGLLHAGNAFVPTLDDLSGAKRERERLVAVHAAVELGAVFEPAGIVHRYGVTLLGFLARADF